MRNNIQDVSSPTAKGSFNDSRELTSDWVVASFPKPKKYGDFPGYPILIVNSPNVSQDSFSHGNVKLDGGIIQFTILDKGNTPVNADNVAAQVKQTVQNHWTSTRAIGIGMVNLRSSPNNIQDSGDDTIIKTLEYDFTYSNLPGYIDG